MKQNKPPTKHLTLENRAKIEALLNEHMSIRYIADRLGKAPSTISREISQHTTRSNHHLCDCDYFRECDVKHICGNMKCENLCRTCTQGRKHCAEYKKTVCEDWNARRIKLCNGCPKMGNCHIEKHLYEAKYADKKYRSILTNSRNGYDLTYEQLVRIDNIVTPKIRKGQSIYHICQTNDLGVSEMTVRRLIDSGDLDARRIDLRSAVTRRVRHHRNRDYKTMTVIKDGHKYADYQDYTQKHPVPVVQMDCVEGSKDSRSALLTLFFTVTHLQLAIILEEHTSENVVKALDMLEEILGTELFKQMFPLILTDNGHEFADIDGMEHSLSCGQRTHVFFCEPNHPEQKGGCERNHELIRYVIPKGTDLDQYTQVQINLMMNHVNSYCRKELYGCAPIDVAVSLYPKDFIVLLGIERILPAEVTLTPRLFKKHNITE